MPTSPGGVVDGVNDYVNDGVVDRQNGYPFALFRVQVCTPYRPLERRDERGHGVAVL